MLHHPSKLISVVGIFVLLLLLMLPSAVVSTQWRCFGIFEPWTICRSSDQATPQRQDRVAPEGSLLQKQLPSNWRQTSLAWKLKKTEEDFELIYRFDTFAPIGECTQNDSNAPNSFPSCAWDDSPHNRPTEGFKSGGRGGPGEEGFRSGENGGPIKDFLRSVGESVLNGSDMSVCLQNFPVRNFSVASTVLSHNAHSETIFVKAAVTETRSRKEEAEEHLLSEAYSAVIIPSLNLLIYSHWNDLSELDSRLVKHQGTVELWKIGTDSLTITSSQSRIGLFQYEEILTKAGKAGLANGEVKTREVFSNAHCEKKESVFGFPNIQVENRKSEEEIVYIEDENKPLRPEIPSVDDEKNYFPEMTNLEDSIKNLVLETVNVDSEIKAPTRGFASTDNGCQKSLPQIQNINEEDVKFNPEILEESNCDEHVSEAASKPNKANTGIHDTSCSGSCLDDPTAKNFLNEEEQQRIRTVFGVRNIDAVSSVVRHNFTSPVYISCSNMTVIDDLLSDTTRVVIEQSASSPLLPAFDYNLQQIFYQRPGSGGEEVTMQGRKTSMCVHGRWGETIFSNYVKTFNFYNSEEGPLEVHLNLTYPEKYLVRLVRPLEAWELLVQLLLQHDANGAFKAVLEVEEVNLFTRSSAEVVTFHVTPAARSSPEEQEERSDKDEEADYRRPLLPLILSWNVHDDDKLSRACLGLVKFFQKVHGLEGRDGTTLTELVSRILQVSHIEVGRVLTILKHVPFWSEAAAGEMEVVLRSLAVALARAGVISEIENFASTEKKSTHGRAIFHAAKVVQMFDLLKTFFI